MLGYCWINGEDGGPISPQYWANVSCLLGVAYSYTEREWLAVGLNRLGRELTFYDPSSFISVLQPFNSHSADLWKPWRPTVFSI